MSENVKTQTPVREHIDRCIELYGQPINDESLPKAVDRGSYEQMRCDLMLALGMLSAREP